jgi:hypothetical protein
MMCYAKRIEVKIVYLAAGMIFKDCFEEVVEWKQS